MPILILLAAIALVLYRLPRVELGHSQSFLRRRFFNWFPLGLTYAFLYMGRYNLTVSKNALGDLMTKEDFGTIFFWGTLTYGLAFLINGPLTDKLGGRKTILLSAAGAAIANVGMGVVLYAVLNGQSVPAKSLVPIFSVLYATNMYFQSFGAVSIVKVNAAWFHVRERGVLGGVFGTLISLGIYFAFDWGQLIVSNAPTWWVFFVPALILGALFFVDLFLIRDTPGQAGHRDFDTADASSGDTGPALGLLAVAKRMFAQPVMYFIVGIEFCSGFLRNAVMHWYPIFAAQTGIKDSFVPANWGMLLCVAGILGGMMAGLISDRIFDSRRGPVTAVLYGGLLSGTLLAMFSLTSSFLGWIVVFMSLCVIGVHGMLSGTASMDFGGKRNAGIAVGIIDGFVYLGTAAQALILGKVLPAGTEAQDPLKWSAWPLLMVPLAAVGFLLATRVWNARPRKHSLSAIPIQSPAPAPHRLMPEVPPQAIAKTG